MYKSTLLALALSVTLAAATPIPLEVAYDTQPGAADAAHASKIDKAKNDANAQIRNMQSTLDNPNDPVNAQRIRDAFGPQATHPAHFAEIRNKVNRLQNGHLQVASANPQVADAEKGRPALAKVSLNRKPDGSFESMGSAKIGSRFHKDTFTDKQRAGTLIHEATHQQSRTGDDVITQGMGKNIVVPAGIKPAGPAAHGINKEGGYARKDTQQINSAADLSQEYKTLRDSSPNMHQNADSYRVFGALCSRSLYKRALLHEDPVGYLLARRSQCTLPPDYFAKKAAAKAASQKTAAISSKSPAKADKASAKTGLTKSATVKGAKPTIAKGTKPIPSKAAKSTTAKGAKSALPKGTKLATSKSTKLTTSKGTKPSKAKGTKPITTKGAKAAAKSTKPITSKGAKSATAKGSKSALPKGTKLPTPKGTKSVKAKGTNVKPSKGPKPATTKGAKPKTAAVKATKSKGSTAQRAGKGSAKSMGAVAPKAAKTTNGPKTVKGAKSTKTPRPKAGAVTPSNPRKSTASTKAASKLSTKVASKDVPKVAKPPARGAAASPKKGGKKVRRDLESVLEELD